MIGTSPSFSRATLLLTGVSGRTSQTPEVGGFIACAPSALFATASTLAGDDALLRFDDPIAPGCVLWSTRRAAPGGFGPMAATDTFVAWLHRDESGLNLRVADADGGNARVVAGGLSEWVTLRAAGDHLVYAISGDLWLYTHSSGRLENLTRTGSVVDADLSRDRVAWLDLRDAPPADMRATEVYVMDLRDRVSTRLTHAPTDRPVRRADVSFENDWIAWIEVSRTAQVVPWQQELRTEIHGYHLGVRREVLLAADPLYRSHARIIDGALYFNCSVPTLSWGINTSDGGIHRLALPAREELVAAPGVVGEGAGCDRSGRLSVCVAGSSCQPGETTPSCVRDGVRGGRCRLASPACDVGLVCNLVTETCATEAATGDLCDPSGRAGTCAGGRRCAPAGGTWVCAEDGAVGGRCRSSAVGTDLCLASGLRCGLDGRCVREVPRGEACDPGSLTTACAFSTYTACITRASGPVCAVLGTLGSGCRLPWISASGSPRCDAGLVCSEGRLCLEVVPAGSPCDPTEALNTCARGSFCVAAHGEHRCTLGPYVFAALETAQVVDACALGRRLPLAGSSRDETHTAEPVEIPFAFEFYGSARSAIWPSLNGYAVFGRRPPQESTRGPLPLTHEDDVVAPLLSDLTLGVDGSGICAAVLGAAPQRSLVIVWDSMRHRNRPDSHLRFALVLHEGGSLDFVYDRVDPAGDTRNDGGPWTFVQGPPGTLAAAYASTATSGSGLRLSASR